jgi:hypothetical protein
VDIAKVGLGGLRRQPELPDPLGGIAAASDAGAAEMWATKRRPELMDLFQTYEYGAMPGEPATLHFERMYESDAALDGLATVTEYEVVTSVPTLSFRLLRISSNGANGPVPCFVGLNFSGNHRVIDDVGVRVTSAWVDDRILELTRSRPNPWRVEECLRRGYALATLYYGEIVSDRADLAQQRLVEICNEVEGKGPATDRGPSGPGSLAMWAWALSRAVDVLSEDPAIDPGRIAVMGHSRNGKAALLAGAFDTRIAVVIAHQAGCAGSAPNRVPKELADEGEDGRPRVETVAAITKAFPHWFCPNFAEFAGRVEYLPFDQHELIALCAPRPVLLSNGVEDEWANPSGQFAMLKAADPVFRLLTGHGAAPEVAPDVGTLAAGRLGWFLREGGHSAVPEDWEAWLSYADVWL